MEAKSWLAVPERLVELIDGPTPLHCGCGEPIPVCLDGHRAQGDGDS